MMVGDLNKREILSVTGRPKYYLASGYQKWASYLIHHYEELAFSTLVIFKVVY